MYLPEGEIISHEHQDFNITVSLEIFTQESYDELKLC